METKADQEAGGDITVAGVAELAEILNLSARRVRQMREDGLLVVRGRGEIDVTHAILFRMGRIIVGNDAALRADKLEIAAAGWLMGHCERGVSPRDLAAWTDAAERWGVGRSDAQALLLRGAMMLGRAAPEMNLSAGSGRGRR